MKKSSIFKENLLNIIIIFLCVIVLYGQTAKFEFTNYDDDRLIVNQEKFLSNLKNIFETFKNDVFNNPNRTVIFYRPILVISFILNYKLFGLDSSAFHLINVFIHFINTILVYYFLFVLWKNKKYALLGSLIFCVHPVQVESVAWLSGRNDLLLGFFTLLMLIFYSASYNTKKHYTLYIILTTVCFTIGIFTKEPAVFFGLLFVLYDLIINSSKLNKFFTPSYLIKYFVLFGVVIFYLSVRYSVFGTLFGSGELYKNSSFLQNLINAPLILGKYLQLLVFPINLSILHTTPSIELWGGFALILSILIISALVVISINYSKSYKLISFGILWILIALIPASNIIPTPIPILEHRLYVPMIGFSILIVAIIEQLYKFIKRNIVDLLSYSLVLILGITSFFRLPVWQNSETLWNDVIKKSSEYDLAYYNLGTYYLQQNRINDAIVYLKFAQSKNPNKKDVLMNLGYAYLMNKNYEEAAQVYERLIRVDPYDEQGYIGRGNALSYLKKYEDAKEVYLAGLAKLSNSEKLHYELGLCYGLLKDHQKAEIELKKAIEINKRYGLAYFSLGGLYSYIGKDSLAIKYMEEGMKYDKPGLGVYFILANSYLRLGDTVKSQYYRSIYDKFR